MQSHIMDFPHPLLMKTENILRESKLELSMSQIPGLTEIIEMVFMTYFFRLLNSILSHCCYCVFALRGVYMTPERLSPRAEFTPVPSHGSIFVYMIPPQNVMPARVTPA